VAREPYLGPGKGKTSGRTPFLGTGKGKVPGRTPYLGKSSAKSGGASLGGLLGNISDEFKSFVYGLPAATKMAVTDPVKLAKLTGKAYAEQYGPLFRGDFGEFAHQVYENPLSTALDAAALVSVGASAAARAGVLTPARAVALRTASGAEIPKLTSRKALRAHTQSLADKALKATTRETTPVLGEYARAGRVQARMLKRPAKALEHRAINFERSIKKLRANDRAAMWALARIPNPAAYDEVIRRWRAEGGAAARNADLLENARTRRMFDNPSKNIEAALADAKRLGDEMAVVLGLPDDVVEASKLRTLRQLGDEYTTGITRDPIYLPDVMDAKGASKLTFGRGGGLAQQAKTSSERLNQGVLFQHGNLILDPGVLSQRYIQAVKKGHYDATHQTLIEHSVALTADEIRANKPRLSGWRVVREKRSDRVPYTIRSQAALEDWLDSTTGPVDDVFLKTPDELARDTLTTSFDNLEEAVQTGKKFHLVPETYVKTLAGEFTRTSTFAYVLQKYPVRVWRAMVLNLRPAWLVNNVLGNTLMYALYNADARGAQALLSSFKKSWPKHADEFEQLFRKHFPEQAQGTFIGTQRPVGFTSKRGRVTRGVGKAVGSLAELDKTYETILRRAAVKAELRKHPALKKRALAMRDETKTFWKAIDQELAKNPQLVDQISRRVNDALGDFSSLSSVERNFLRSVFPFYAWFRAITIVTVKLPLEQAEKAALLGRMSEIAAEDSLAQMGLTSDEVPGFFKGMVPLGPESGGRVPVLSTGPANPFGTTVDIQEFLTALLSGQPGSAGKQLPGVNPLFAAPAQALFGVNISTGAPLPRTPGGVLGASARQITENLPQYRVGEAALGKRYQGTADRPTLYEQDLRDILLRYLGIPYARVSPSRGKSLPRG